MIQPTNFGFWILDFSILVFRQDFSILVSRNIMSNFFVFNQHSIQIIQSRGQSLTFKMDIVFPISIRRKKRETRMPNNWLCINYCKIKNHAWSEKVSVGSLLVQKKDLDLVLDLDHEWIKSFPFLYLCRHNDNSQMSMRFKGRVIVLSCLGLGLYPFLWAWTVIGCIWFTNSRNCVSNGMVSLAQYFDVCMSHILLLRN